MSICNKCKKEKSPDKFFKDKIRKSGITRWCKSCMNKQSRKWKRNNTKRIKEYMVVYRNENKEQISKKAKEYKIKNKETIQKKEKEYRRNNIEKRRNWKREYYQRCKNDPQFKIKTNLYNRIWKVLRGINKSSKTFELLGCNLKTAIHHIEGQFKEGMSWKNYGDWHIDHIKPCSNFDLTITEQQKECFNYKNLQPLWASDNCSKQDRWIG